MNKNLLKRIISYASLSCDANVNDAIAEISVFQENSKSYVQLLNLNRIRRNTAVQDDYTEKNFEIPGFLKNEKTLLNFLEIVVSPFSVAIPPRLLPVAENYILMSGKCNIGEKILFATSIRSIALLSDIVSSASIQKESRKSLQYASKAIAMLNNAKLPPLFYPDLTKRPFLRIPAVGIRPNKATALATSQNSVFIGCRNSQICKISFNSKIPFSQEFISIPLIENEPYSLIYTNKGLLMCTDKGRVIFYSLETSNSFEISVSFSGHYFYHLNTFTPPVVTDGNLLYSVSFGGSPRIKVFQFSLDSIIFVKSISLRSGSSKLVEPFTELLPARYKDFAPIATNGVYLSVILRSHYVSICRIFSVRTGMHLHDVVLDPSLGVYSWLFDINKPGHLLMLERELIYLKSRFTLPLWQVDIKEPDYNYKIHGNTTQGILLSLYNSLNTLAIQCIGANTDISFHIYDDSFMSSIEIAFCVAITDNYFYGAQAFLIFLDLKLWKNQEPNSSLSNVLDNFLLVIKDDKYKALRGLVGEVFLSHFDEFCSSNAKRSSEVLISIIDTWECKKDIFKHLLNSQLLIDALTPELIAKICDISLETSFLYDDLAMSLLSHIQFWLCNSKERKIDIFLIYLNRLSEQFQKDFNEYKNGKWSGQRFVNCVSFIVLRNLTNVVGATDPNKILSYGAASIFFLLGCNSFSNKLEEAKVIWKTIYDCLFISFEIGFNFIGQNECFTFLSQEKESISYTEEEFQSFVDEIGIKKPGAFEEIYDRIMEIAFLCNRENTTVEFVRKKVSKLIRDVVHNKIDSNVIKERIENIRKIMPQVFKNVFDYLFGKIKELNIARSEEESLTVKFLTLLNQNLIDFTTEKRVILLFFLPQLQEISPYLTILSPSFINHFISTFPFRFFLPPKMVRISGFKFSAESILKLNKGEFFLCYDNIYSISDCINNPCILIDKFRSIKQTDIVDKTKKKSLMRKIMLAKIGIKAGCTKRIESSYICRISKKFLMTGNYLLIMHILELIEIVIDQNKIDVTDFLKFAFNAVGRFLTRKQIFFIEQSNQYVCTQCTFLIAEFFRKILAKHTFVRNFIKEQLAKKSIENYVASFAIMNNTIDITRKGTRVTFYDGNNEYYDDIVSFYGKDLSNVNLKNSIKEFHITDINNMCAQSTVKFDPLVFEEEDFPEIIKAFESFESTSPIFNIFMLASFNEFIKIDKFAQICSHNLVKRLLSKVKVTNEKPETALNRFYQIFSFYFNPIPPFAFDSKQRTDNITKLAVSSQNIMKGAVLNANLQKKKNTKNTIFSYENPIKFFSAPLHTRVSSLLQLSSEFPEGSPTTVVIQMMGKEYGLSFITEKFQFSVAEIRIDAENNELFFKADSIEHTYAIQGSCDMIFVTLYLQQSSIVNYSFSLVNETMQKGEKFEFMANNTSLSPSFPPDMSQEFYSQNLIEMCEPLLSYLAIRSYVRYKLNTEIVKDPKLIAFCLLNFTCYIDSNPLSSLMTFEFMDYSKVFMGAGKELMDYIEKVIKMLLEDAELSKKVFNELINFVNEEIDTYSKNYITNKARAATLFINKLPQRLAKSYIIMDDEIILVNENGVLPKEEKEKFVAVMTKNISGTILQLIVDLRHLFAIILKISQNRFILCNYYNEFRDVLLKAVDSIKLKQIRKLLEYTEMAFPDKHTEPTSLDQWFIKTYPEFFKEFVFHTGSDPRQFFFLDNALNVFPASSFVLKLLEATSYASSTVTMGKNMVSFYSATEKEGENIFLTISFDKEIPVVFELSHDSNFSEITEVYPNKCYIIPPTTFFIRPKTDIDIEKAQFFWRTFVLTESQITEYLKEVEKWKPRDSILLSSMAQKEMKLSEEDFLLMPLSSKFSFEIAAFYWDIINECYDLECCETIERHSQAIITMEKRKIAFRNESVSKDSYESFVSFIESLCPFVFNTLADMTGAVDEISVYHIKSQDVVINSNLGLIGIGDFDDFSKIESKIMELMYSYLCKNM